MNHLSKMATCWKLRLGSGKLLCFTDSDQDLIYKRELYICGNYFTPSYIISSNELGQDECSISGIIDGEYIRHQSLIAGDFSESYIEIFLINIDNLSAEQIILKTGWLGEIKIHDQGFTAQLRSIGMRSNNLIGQCYSASCRAEFGDKQCSITIDNYSFTGEVSALAEVNCFIDNMREEPDDYFTHGVIAFTSGDNLGRKYKVREFRHKKISLDFIADLKISMGDQYSIIAGCDKTLNTCINKFNNALSFRGEPFVPSKHKLVAGN